MFAANGGAASADSTTYIEDVFSTYLYTGTGSNPTFINNGIALTSTNGFTAYELDTSAYGYANSLASGFSGVYTSGYHNGIPYINRRNSSGVIDLSLRLAGAVPSDIAIDSSGNIYCAAGAYLLKINSSGSVVWQKTTISRTITSVAFDSFGNVYFTCSNAGSSGYNLISLDSSGAWRWGKDLSDNGGPRVKVDSQDNVYVFGRSTTYYAYVSKLDTSGTVAWGKSIKVGLSGNNAQAMTNDVAIDSSGNVYMATQMGSSSVSTDSWGPGIVKYDSTGVLQWVSKLQYSSTYGTPMYRSVGIDNSGNIITIGYADRGSASSNYMIVSSYATNGSLNWTKKILSDGNQTYYASPKMAIVSNTVNTTAYVVPLGGGTTPYYHMQFNISSPSFEGSLSFSNNNLYIAAENVSAVTPINISDSGANSISSYTETLGSSTDVTVTVAATVIWRKKVLPATISDGGLVWVKTRTTGTGYLTDTVKGTNSQLSTSSTNAESTITTAITAFNPSGYSLGDFVGVNTSAENYASWTFRKAPKFFDVVTYTGNGAAGRTISHSLGQAPGMIIIKRTNTTGNWIVYHRSLGNSNFVLLHNTNASAADGGAYFNSTDPTSSTFTLGSGGQVNTNGDTYVAYLFAHDTTTDGMIQCGSYTGNGSTGQSINLGWEPQYVLIKRTDTTSDWTVVDAMRGLYAPTTTTSALLANTAGAENSGYAIYSNATGFALGTGVSYNASGGTYIYMAIRRPMKVPTDGTNVFVPTLGVNATAGSVMYNTGFPVDAVFEGWREGSGNNATVVDRLRGNYNYLVTSSNNIEFSDGGYRAFDSNAGLKYNISLNATSILNAWAFKRAPGFFDVVCYTGYGTATYIDHNLGVTPELMIVKKRSEASTTGWAVYCSSLNNSANSVLYLNTTNGVNIDGTAWASDPSSTRFRIGGSNTNTNGSGKTFVAYLFASCPGVSKVGSYTGTGSTLNIDCGFSAGARFVLIKRTDTTGNWVVFDTARGIVSSNDPYLLLNTPSAEDSSFDAIDPYAAGFTLTDTAPADVNANGGTYIYLAIA